MEKKEVVVIISADIEWQVIRNLAPELKMENSPFGEYFPMSFANSMGNRSVMIFQGGWGKISAAASAQYAIDRWNPSLLINLGTCGGFEGEIEKGSMVLVERTIVYDIFEEMGDAEDHISYYTTELDLYWLQEPYPEPVSRGLMVSGDRDLSPDDIGRLIFDFGAFVGDWESGSIAFVAKRNNVPCLILRGVSDLVGKKGGEAYGDLSLYKDSARKIMTHLMNTLPAWIECADVFRS